MKAKFHWGRFWAGLGVLAALGLCVIPASAQSYAMSWYRIAGGGGASSGGIYSVNGTIGQAEAGVAMTGGGFSLTGGFWSMFGVVQTAGLPKLLISHSGSSVTVSWAATGSYTLQQTPRLNGGAWTTSTYSVTTTNGMSSITIGSPSGNLFFRLSQ